MSGECTRARGRAGHRPASRPVMTCSSPPGRYRRTRRLVTGPRGPVHELDDDAVRVGDLEGALPPLLDCQRHGDGGSLRAQPGQFPFEIIDDKGEDQAGGVVVTLIIGQRFQAPAEEDDVHRGVLAAQRRKAVGGHLLAEAEVLGEEGTGCGDVLDIQGHGRSGDMHGLSPWAKWAAATLSYIVLCTTYNMVRCSRARPAKRRRRPGPDPAATLA